MTLGCLYPLPQSTIEYRLHPSPDRKGTALTQDASSHEDSHSTRPPSRWKENHGNLLLGFVGVVVLIGASVLLYIQNRFVPPRFPESDMIANPESGDSVAATISPGEAVIRITGAANDYGQIKVAIYGSDTTFNQPPDAAFAQSSSIQDGEAILILTVEDLPEQIAVAAFHDENDDGTLNRNRFGIPSERYGFSRNARGLTGPPTFGQTVIPRPQAGATIEIFVR